MLRSTVKAVLASAITASALVHIIAAQPVVLEGSGPKASVEGLPTEWRLILGWPNSTLIAREHPASTAWMGCASSQAYGLLCCASIM